MRSWNERDCLSIGITLRLVGGCGMGSSLRDESRSFRNAGAAHPWAGLKDLQLHSQDSHSTLKGGALGDVDDAEPFTVA